MPIYYRPKDQFEIVKVSDIEPFILGADRETRVLLALAFLTGARVGELLLLIKKSVLIDEEHSDIRFLIPTLKLKQTYLRELPFDIKTDPFLESVILPYIKALPTEETKLFRHTKAQYQINLHELNKKLYGSETSKYITFHYLRHSDITYITRVLRASGWEVQSHTGHHSSAYETYMIHGSTERFKGKMKR